MAHVNRSPRLWNSPGRKFNPPVPGDKAPAGVRGPLTGANMVDPNDPAYGEISRAAMELIGFGFDPNNPDIAQRAIEVGRERYAKHPTYESRMGLIPKPPEPFERVPGEFVYYMRIGNRVKIGWTTNLTTRLATINPEELMTTEPGNRILENARHHQFKELRTHGEWFRLEEPLIQHIEDLRGIAAREAS